jgi:hypothetical protein
LGGSIMPGKQSKNNQSKIKNHERENEKSDKSINIPVIRFRSLFGYSFDRQIYHRYSLLACNRAHYICPHFVVYVVLLLFQEKVKIYVIQPGDIKSKVPQGRHFINRRF